MWPLSERAILNSSNKLLWQATYISRKKRCKRSSASCAKRFLLEDPLQRECNTRSIRVRKRKRHPVGADHGFSQNNADSGTASEGRYIGDVHDYYLSPREGAAPTVPRE